MSEKKRNEIFRGIASTRATKGEMFLPPVGEGESVVGVLSCDLQKFLTYICFEQYVLEKKKMEIMTTAFWSLVRLEWELMDFPLVDLAVRSGFTLVKTRRQQTSSFGLPEDEDDGMNEIMARIMSKPKE